MRKLWKKRERSQRIRGITRRWMTNTLFVTAMILLLICVIGVLTVVLYYRNYVSNVLSANANENVTTFFSQYLGGTDDVFNSKAKEFVESFSGEDYIEVMVINRHGKASVSSSGFPVTETLEDMPDVREAVSSASSICRWTGFNENGEHIMSVAMALPSDNGAFSGAVRFMTSLKGVDSQCFAFAGIVAVIYVIAMGLVLLSGMFFVQSIVAPVREISESTKKIAEGDFQVEIKTTGHDDEINDLAEAVRNMTNELSASDKMKNDFISTVSHELRTPLTAIKGWGEMLKELDGEDRELSRRGTEVIISESERLSRLVEELLDFSRIQNGSMTLRKEKIDVLAELDEAVFVFKERSKRDGIELTYSVPETPAPMNADPNRIKQVFVNVLDNAFKYTKKGGQVEVSAALTEDMLTIYVTDTGCGISPEDLPNVKKKFYKANLQVRGSGIGLAVVDEIVRLHNGIFEINSELGVGTTVTLAFPVDATVPEEPTPASEEMVVDTNEQFPEQNA